MEVRCIVCHKAFDIPDHILEHIIMDFDTDYEHVNFNYSCQSCNRNFDTIINAFFDKILFRNANQN